MAEKILLDPAVVLRFVANGMAPDVVAVMLNASEEDVRAVLEKSELTDVPPPEIDDVARAMRALSLRVIQELFIMLDEGSPAIKQRLLPTLFTKLVPLIDAGDDSSAEELRALMTTMFDDFKPVPQDPTASPGGEDGN
jgi:cytochrome P450